MENYQARGMELEKDAMDARASFELACQEHSVAKERPLPLHEFLNFKSMKKSWNAWYARNA